MLNSLPMEVLAQLNAALEEAAKKQAIPAEAMRAMGVNDGLDPRYRR